MSFSALNPVGSHNKMYCSSCCLMGENCKLRSRGGCKACGAEPDALKRELEAFFTSKEGPDWKPSSHAGQSLKGIIAPHYDLRQGGPIYAWAYKEVQEAAVPDVFVILGTCQAGLEHGYALTDKDFETPLGRVPVDRDVLDRVRNRGDILFSKKI